MKEIKAKTGKRACERDSNREGELASMCALPEYI